MHGVDGNERALPTVDAALVLSRPTVEPSPRAPRARGSGKHGGGHREPRCGRPDRREARHPRDDLVQSGRHLGLHQPRTLCALRPREARQRRRLRSLTPPVLRWPDRPRQPGQTLRHRRPLTPPLRPPLVLPTARPWTVSKVRRCPLPLFQFLPHGFPTPWRARARVGDSPGYCPKPAPGFSARTPTACVNAPTWTPARRPHGSSRPFFTRGMGWPSAPRAGARAG